MALVGGTIILMNLVVAFLAPYIAPYHPFQQNFRMMNKGISADHWLGCDYMGRDIFSRILYGTLVTLRISFIAVTMGLLLGTLIGMIGGYYGKKVDMIVVFFTDILLTFPDFLLAVAVIAAIGPGMTGVIMASGFSSIPQFIRITRGVVLKEKDKDYVVAAKAIGESNISIMLRYVLPNCMVSIIVLTTLRMAVVILIASGLSFLGLGPPPPSPEWGAMLSEGRPYLQTAPQISVFPGFAIMILVLAFNLFGDGLRDALDPRMKI
jgi:peptide/nickel transport system permease protein